MLILTHPNTNVRHGQPKDWNEERDGPCGALPTITEGFTHISFWQPSPEELAVLMRGGSIQFAVQAIQHPVVSMGVNEWPNQLHDADGNKID